MVGDIFSLLSVTLETLHRFNAASELSQNVKERINEIDKDLEKVVSELKEIENKNFGSEHEKLKIRIFEDFNKTLKNLHAISLEHERTNRFSHKHVELNSKLDNIHNDLKEISNKIFYFRLHSTRFVIDGATYAKQEFLTIFRGGESVDDFPACDEETTSDDQSENSSLELEPLIIARERNTSVQYCVESAFQSKKEERKEQSTEYLCFRKSITLTCSVFVAFGSLGLNALFIEYDTISEKSANLFNFVFTISTVCLSISSCIVVSVLRTFETRRPRAIFTSAFVAFYILVSSIVLRNCIFQSLLHLVTIIMLIFLLALQLLLLFYPDLHFSKNFPTQNQILSNYFACFTVIFVEFSIDSNSFEKTFIFLTNAVVHYLFSFLNAPQQIHGKMAHIYTSKKIILAFSFQFIFVWLTGRNIAVVLGFLFVSYLIYFLVASFSIMWIDSFFNLFLIQFSITLQLLGNKCLFTAIINISHNLYLKSIWIHFKSFVLYIVFSCAVLFLSIFFLTPDGTIAV